MENLFLKYMSGLHKEDEKEPEKRELGPVITLSRQYGCYGSEIAQMICDEINKLIVEERWQVVSKEVLEDAAKRLKVNPTDISHIFGAEEKGFLTDLRESFRNNYTSDSQIKRAISRVVKAYAEGGECVIVGRAGCVIGKHIKKALHVRLFAPFNYRVTQIQKRFSIDEKTAQKQVADIDKKREVFMSFFSGNKPDADLFDAVFNRATLSNQQIVAQIIELAQFKNLFK